LTTTSARATSVVLRLRATSKEFPFALVPFPEEVFR
jgi:hypothetical protein